VGHVIIHARKAWLQGLSPRENREIPPLDHALALAMKARFPELSVSVNGGVTSLDQARDLLAQGFDGVMVGRAAYHDPAAILGAADSLWGDPAGPDPVTVALRMRAVIADHLAAGGRMHQITRHMLGLFAGRPGARAWRRLLSEGAGEGLAAYDRALEAVSLSAAA
jgi:tRNA-dihydrouridine synthase A